MWLVNYRNGNGLVNIQNEGYRCYANTVLQSLTTIKELNNHFLSNADRFFNEQYDHSVLQH